MICFGLTVGHSEINKLETKIHYRSMSLQLDCHESRGKDVQLSQEYSKNAMKNSCPPYKQNF